MISKYVRSLEQFIQEDLQSRIDPLTGYWERNTDWFNQTILPDFLNQKKLFN